MKKKKSGFLVTGLVLGVLLLEAGEVPTNSELLATNKSRVMTIAVQGRVAHPQVSRGYTVTWDGKPKLAVGTGGINYDIKLGQRVFGWASGDRATMGVSAEGTGVERTRDAWPFYASIGNEVKVLSGGARGGRGVVVGKFGDQVLVHFEDDVLDELAIGDDLQVKACGVGLRIEGYDDVFVHSLAPDALEKIVSIRPDGRLEAPVVKEIPAELVGQGSGGSSLTGHWNIQTCFPPDIHAHGLEDLRFGDLVLLKDTESDYGKGYFKGAVTVGVVCSGPSDVSGLGIGVTPILSTKTGRLAARLDPGANIAGFLGLEAGRKKKAPEPAAAGLRTNKEGLIVTAVQGVVQPPAAREYSVSYDGRPTLGIGMASINYSVTLGDPVDGWAEADHVEPDVTIQGRDRPSPSDCALAVLACIGNVAEVMSGEARGAKGYYLGRHAGSDDKVWFPREAVEKLALNDVVQVKAEGVGLKIEDFEDVRVNKLSPGLLERMGIVRDDRELVVPVVMEIPGHIMGSGLGGSSVETLDYDIQTTCPETVERYGLKRLRLGDVVAIRDHYDFYGRGRYEGAMTIGVVIHGFSKHSGHGPGVNPVLSALPGRIKTRLDPMANIAFYLGIKNRP